MIIEVPVSDIYYPEWNKNLELPEEERVSIEWKYPDISKSNVLNPRPTFKTVLDMDGKFKETTTETKTDYTYILREMVVSFRGLSYRKGGIEKKVATVSQLFEAPSLFSGLIDDVGKFLKKKLEESEIAEKN